MFSPHDGDCLEMRVSLPHDEDRDFLLPMSISQAQEALKTTLPKHGATFDNKHITHVMAYIKKWDEFMKEYRAADQMQMQMECTGIDECEYVEFRFKQVFYAEWVAFQGRKGVFVIFEDETVSYTKDASWTERENQKVHWILQSVKKDFVPKDPKWLSSHFDDLKSFWDDVVKHREAGTKPAPLPSTTVTIDL
jgi:hypothetical protein